MMYRDDLERARAEIEGEERSLLPFLTIKELMDMSGEKTDWVVPGFAANGAITELSGKVKSGKTTFAIKMARSVLHGQEFLGRPAAHGQVLLLSEEGHNSLGAAFRRAGLVDEPGLRLLLRHQARMRHLSWPEIAEGVALLCDNEEVTLVIIDTLAAFTRVDDENDAAKAAAVMEPLRYITATGASVVYTRHDRKSGGQIGDSGRGSSAYSGYADILVQFGLANQIGHPTRRLLNIVGRFDDSEELVIELLEGEYVVQGDSVAVERNAARGAILSLLQPPGVELLLIPSLVEKSRQSDSTVRRTVEDLEGEGYVGHEGGHGERGTAHGYWLTEAGVEYRDSLTLPLREDPEK